MRPIYNCDFVADVRASTPSVAAELAVPVKSEQENLILQAQIRLRQALSRRLERQRLRLDHLLVNRILRRPLEITDRRRLDVDRLVQRLVTVTQTNVRQAERRFSILAGKLDALSPLKVLARGYGVVTRAADNSVLLSTALVKPGENIEVWLRDGIINCDVRQVRDWRR